MPKKIFRRRRCHEKDKHGNDCEHKGEFYCKHCRLQICFNHLNFHLCKALPVGSIKNEFEKIKEPDSKREKIKRIGGWLNKLKETQKNNLVFPSLCEHKLEKDKIITCEYRHCTRSVCAEMTKGHVNSGREVFNYVDNHCVKKYFWLTKTNKLYCLECAEFIHEENLNKIAERIVALC